MKNIKLKTILLVASVVTIPLISIMYLAAELAKLPFVPDDFFSWLGRTVSSLITTVVLDATIAVLLLLNINVDDTIASVGRIAALVLFWLFGVAITATFFTIMKRRPTSRGLSAGLGLGALLGILMALIGLSTAAEPSSLFMRLLWLVALFSGWGLGLGHIYERLVIAQSAEIASDVDQPIETVTRRQFLSYLSAGAAVITVVNTALGKLAVEAKSRQRAVNTAIVTALDNPTSFPAALKAKIYPSDPEIQFPELQMARYQPDKHPIGVCFSGGGSRSLIASVGQMRGLHALGVLDDIGAISAVSGGAWFSTVFNFAPTNISDTTLLGPVLSPTEITPQNLAEIDPQCIAAPLMHLTSSNMATMKTAFMIGAVSSESQAFNRVYARLLNDLLLKPFHLDDTHTFFTLDSASVERIIGHNPGLKPDDFYTMRPNRPFLMVGAIHVHPLGENQVSRAFEYTPLYSGTPQLFRGAGINGADVGGGYVESFAFDSLTPSTPDANNYVTVTTPNPVFLLSDVIASSSAAPGLILNQFEAPEWFPKFNYWPVVNAGDQPAANYSFIDGSGLETSGIVPLLRRQYPIILAFVNSRQAIGLDNPSTVDGIDHQVSRLFGFKGQNSGDDQDVQIFPADKFKALADGLKRTKANGDPPIFIDSYPIIQPNTFDLPSYPDNGEATVMWFYNDVNPNWQRRLSSRIQTLLTSTEPTNYMANFPNFKTYFQNHSESGIPQILQYTPEQINLLAHMWAYTVMEDAGEMIQALKKRVI